MNGFNMSDVTNYMLGSTQVSEVYYGSTLIWPLGYQSNDYLTFEVLDNNCNFKFSKEIQYSTDDGVTWITLPANTYIYPNMGDKIMWKATADPVYNGGTLVPGSTGVGRFVDNYNSSGGYYKVSGNVMSLLYGDRFGGITSLTGKDCAFACLFDGCTYITDISGLELPATTLSYRCYADMFYSCHFSSVPSNLLPATTLADSCYEAMFQECNYLTVAPDLPASTLVEYCYERMFRNCTRLNSIKCLATTIPSNSGATSYWVHGVAASGTFTKAASMNSWTTGASGIPSGWAVQDAS